MFSLKYAMPDKADQELRDRSMAAVQGRVALGMHTEGTLASREL